MMTECSFLDELSL